MKCDVTARNFKTDAKMKAYVDEKLGGLEKYLPRDTRETASCAVILENDTSGREDNQFVCEAVVTVHGAQMVSREGTVNIYAAIDIVEAKLKAQFVKYKEKHTTEPRRGKMLSRLIGRKSEAEEAVDEEIV